MKPVAATDTDKALDTLRSCLDALNTHGALGTLRWLDGFAVSLGTVVHTAMAPIADTHAFAFVYAVQGFEEGGTHHAGYHVHRIVNWSAEDPPLIFAVIDDEGRTLEFSLLEPSCEWERVEFHAAWQRQLAVDPVRQSAAYGRIQEALTSMTRHWSEGGE